MSSTIGYGFEVKPQKDEFGYGDWEEEVTEKFPFLKVVTSRAEYGDEERVFLLIKESITEAGKDSTAAKFNPIKHSTEDLAHASQDALVDVTDEGWFLVDYYVYS